MGMIATLIPLPKVISIRLIMLVALGTCPNPHATQAGTLIQNPESTLGYTLSSDCFKRTREMSEESATMSNVTIDTKLFEGLILRSYNDKLGYRTVGYGHNMDKPMSKRMFLKLGIPYRDVYTGKLRITKSQAERLFGLDMAIVRREVPKVVTSYKDHPPYVQNILRDLHYNLGKAKFSEFKKTIAAFNDFDYGKAADELFDSKWYKQVGWRAKSIVNALRDLDESTSQ